MRPHVPALISNVALVTGSGHGIGQGIAELMAEEEAMVVVSDKRGDPQAEARALAVANRITAKRQRATVINCDLGVREHIDHLVDETLQRYGQINVLVNNAFHWDGKMFEDQDWEGLRRYADVNFIGTAYLTQRVARHMREAKHSGAIVFITSVHQETVRREHPWYSMGKAGLVMLIKELAVEYGPYGIRVNGVAPGHIETDDGKVDMGKRAENPCIPLLGVSGLPEDIAKAVVFLCSHAARFITGQVLTVDGGERLWGEWAYKKPPGGAPSQGP